MADAGRARLEKALGRKLSDDDLGKLAKTNERLSKSKSKADTGSDTSFDAKDFQSNMSDGLAGAYGGLAKGSSSGTPQSDMTAGDASMAKNKGSMGLSPSDVSMAKNTQPITSSYYAAPRQLDEENPFTHGKAQYAGFEGDQAVIGTTLKSTDGRGVPSGSGKPQPPWMKSAAPTGGLAGVSYGSGSDNKDYDASQDMYLSKIDDPWAQKAAPAAPKMMAAAPKAAPSGPLAGAPTIGAGYSMMGQGPAFLTAPQQSPLPMPQGNKHWVTESDAPSPMQSTGPAKPGAPMSSVPPYYVGAPEAAPPSAAGGGPAGPQASMAPQSPANPPFPFTSWDAFYAAQYSGQ
jgi:hypothetical protein